LDRIAALRPLGGTFEVPEEFRVSRFLEDAWSLYQGESRREMVIYFDRSLTALIGNAHYHEGETIARLRTGDLEYRVTLAHVEEIARWVVSFGGLAKAVSPPELVMRVREIAGGAAAAHSLEAAEVHGNDIAEVEVEPLGGLRRPRKAARDVRSRRSFPG